ncbi:rod shape-determining protein MreD [Delftia tsuruhatensis]|uniref:rod shape-determining protein MreD n=1 Tax=Delftia tsuruhatensis TaxID=180282 RepID=UPI001E74326C|nr:rod shape-determining protein MreD [Delftia tsuruhatensis]CAB5718774.1 rod shape-determining protein MreD [Delftia tsuruhatensis]CAC9676160.1 rod shape-determining protein MreD [Delftia tsuruhatensis]
MIMPRGQQLLLPVNPLFIVVSLLAALALNMLPLGRQAWQPDLLMVLLAFWALNQPQRVGMGVAFLLGLCMDVDRSSLLGQHALAYALLVFAAGAMSRRLSWFSTPVQALHLLPLFALVHGLQVLLRMVAGGLLPGVPVLVAPLIEALLWPLVSGLLLAPQRRPPDSDENRPL